MRSLLPLGLIAALIACTPAASTRKDQPAAEQAVDDRSPLQLHEQVDIVAASPDGSFMMLVMVETRPWANTPSHLNDLEEKFNTYVGYVLTGKVYEAYPDLKGLDRKIVLMSVEEPYGETRRYIDHIREKYLKPNGIGWSEQLLGKGPNPSFEWMPAAAGATQLQR